jgi:hypothetical protein
MWMGALWLAALLAYSNSFRGELVLDAHGLILEDARVHSVTAENVRRILTEDYWGTQTHSGLYRPLTKLTFLFDKGHWVNFLLHGANMTLAFYLGLVIFGEPWLAFALAALWGLHPALTESITNVVGRADLLAGLAVLAGLLCHIRGKWIGVAVAAAVGVFSKETAVVLVPLMGLYDFAFHKRNWRGYVAAAVPIAVYAAVRMAVLHGLVGGSFPFTDNPLIAAGFWQSRLTAMKVIGRYLLLLIWPAQLSCDYSYNEVPVSAWDDFGAWLALLVCAGSLYAARRRPVLLFFTGVFFVTLLPASNLIVRIGSIMAERFLYLPALGFAGCVVYLLRQAPRPVFIIVCILLVGRTYVRNDDWKTEQSLWASAVKAAPGSYKTHMAAAGDLPFAAAQAELERALAILDPLPDRLSTPVPYINAGGLYRDIGDASPPQNRAAWYRKSLETLERAERIQKAAGSVVFPQLQEELNATRARYLTSYK